MEDIRRILVISRMTPYCREAIHSGVSLARKFGAELQVLHLVSNPFDMKAINAPGIFPKEEYTNYENIQRGVKEELDKIIKQEIKDGFPIKELISDRDPIKEIVRVVKEEKIDLLVMLAHEEGRLEHALFGGDKEAITRKMPCSVLLVKKEPGPVKW
ncbi:MAG: universal stress protein [Deltaproteobacteria bacterium]|nr:universal stress protein [Deltaproteobacteria bacterium]